MEGVNVEVTESNNWGELWSDWQGKPKGENSQIVSKIMKSRVRAGSEVIVVDSKKKEIVEDY